MSLEFKDIGDWTPSTVSIVDVPYHPLAYFEVYENDDEFVKKFQGIDEVDQMSNQNDEKKITMSEGFFEKLFGGSVLKRDPEPQPTNPPAPNNNNNDDSEVSNAQILEAINKQNERITAIENQINNPEPTGDDSNHKPVQDDEGNNNPQPSNEDGDSQNDGGETTPKTVELPLNPDGTLDMDNAVVAKYIPRGSGNSQSVDGDIVRGTVSDKSFNERSGRDENGMSW